MRRISILIAIVVLVAGCGAPSEPKPVPVKMTVTLDGTPMREGDIYLYAPGKPPQAFKIENGTIPAMVPVGTYRVEIALFKPDPDPKKAAAGIDNTNAGDGISAELSAALGDTADLKGILEVSGTYQLVPDPDKSKAGVEIVNITARIVNLKSSPFPFVGNSRRCNRSIEPKTIPSNSLR